jgi:phosphate transport system protein
MQNVFHSKLDETENILLNMGELIDNIFESLLSCFQNKDIKDCQLTDILEVDSKIDALEDKLERICTEMLALYQPMGIDLRYIIGAIKISSNLERIGDHLRKIARKTRKVVKFHDYEHFYSLIEMITLLRQMSEQIMISLKDKNLQLAKDTLILDRKIDQIQRDLFQKLIEKMSKNNDPDIISLGVHLLFITRFLERIGDHIENIGEKIVFIINGEIMDSE